MFNKIRSKFRPIELYRALFIRKFNEILEHGIIYDVIIIVDSFKRLWLADEKVGHTMQSWMRGHQ